MNHTLGSLSRFAWKHYISLLVFAATTNSLSAGNPVKIQLPQPAKQGVVSLEEALLQRRSVRSFAPYAITLQEVGQLLWAGQGITQADRSLRTAPSAGATFPIELYVAIFNAEGITPGLYQYQCKEHSLIMKKQALPADSLVGVALSQQWIKEASAVIFVCAVPARTSPRYGERTSRYVHIEVGHVGQNIALQAVALKLGTTMVGSFKDVVLATILQLPEGEIPLYTIPVGKPK